MNLGKSLTHSSTRVSHVRDDFPPDNLKQTPAIHRLFLTYRGAPSQLFLAALEVGKANRGPPTHMKEPSKQGGRRPGRAG